MLRVEADREFYSKRRSKRSAGRIRDREDCGLPTGAGKIYPTASLHATPSAASRGKAAQDSPTSTAAQLCMEPFVEVSKDGDDVVIKGSVQLGSVHPDTAFKLLTDYRNSHRIFRTVKKVDVEQRGDGCLVTEQMMWRVMPMVRGTYDVKLWASADADSRHVSFKLAEEGFMKTFSSTWGIEPWQDEGKAEMGSSISLEQRMQPRIMPPGPFAPCLLGSVKTQIINVFKDISSQGDLENKAS